MLSDDVKVCIGLYYVLHRLDMLRSLSTVGSPPPFPTGFIRTEGQMAAYGLLSLALPPTPLLHGGFFSYKYTKYLNIKIYKYTNKYKYIYIYKYY